MKKKSFMKIKLMMLSLSPLFLLTIIRNWGFETKAESGKYYGVAEFIGNNAALLVIDIVCIVWVMLSALFFISFLAFKWSGTESGYTIKSVVEKKDASLNFFLTLIVPLLIDDVGSWQGAMSFIIIVSLICVLLYKTELYYSNPVLAILGYHVYYFVFEDNCNVLKGRCFGLCKGKVSDGRGIEYKEIDSKNKIFYIKGR